MSVVAVGESADRMAEDLYLSGQAFRWTPRHPDLSIFGALSGTQLVCREKEACPSGNWLRQI
jgi:hypothetical protein